MAKRRKPKRRVKKKETDFGSMFVGAILLLVAIYLIVSQTDLTAKVFGGGILAIVGLFLFIMPALKKK